VAEEGYPLALYRKGGAFQWDGRPTDMLTVDDADAHSDAMRDGWMEAANYTADIAPSANDDDEYSGLTDDELRDALKDRGQIVHHKTGRTKLLEALREAA
jgi:hypothetical protein